METTTAKTVTVKSWTARNGQVRRYVQGVADIANELYDGLSNANFARASRAKVWIDTEGAVHVDDYALESDYWCGTRKLVAYIESAEIVTADAPARPAATRSANPSARAWTRGASYGVNGQIWDEDI